MREALRAILTSTLQRSTKMSWTTPAMFILAPMPGGVAASMIARRNMNNFYDDLAKPSWHPPKWLPGPIWAMVYTGSGYASYLVWQHGGGFAGRGRTALMMYGATVALNWAWSPIFFGAHRIGLAFGEIMTLWGTIAGCIYMFRPINRTASNLMIPYLIWMTYAAALNYNTWRNNPGKGK